MGCNRRNDTSPPLDGTWIKISARVFSRVVFNAGDDVLSGGEFSECNDAIGDQFRVLDEIGGVADNTWNQDLPAGSFTSRQTFSSVKKRLPTLSRHARYAARGVVII
jgi:hypothetical protein